MKDRQLVLLICGKSEGKKKGTGEEEVCGKT